MKFNVLLLTLTLLMPVAQAWDMPIPVNRAPAPIAIDGVLEESWFDHASVHDLLNYTGRTTNLIVENYLTLFRSMWDDDYWYLSYCCSDDTPLATMTGRDDPIYQEEMCELVFQSPAGRHLYELSVSPLGTVYDTQTQWNRFNEFEVNVKWNFVGLKSAVKIEPLPDKPGRCVWTVELAIPWSSIPGGKPEKGTRWKANALRFKRVKLPALIVENQNRSYLAMSLFGSGIRGWPQGPSSFGEFEFR